MMKYKTSTQMIKIKNTKLKKGNQENQLVKIQQEYDKA